MNPTHKNLIEDIEPKQNRGCVVIVQEKCRRKHVGKNAVKQQVSFFYGFTKKGALQTAWSAGAAKIMPPYQANNVCGIIRNKGYYCHVVQVSFNLLGGAV